MPALEWAYGTIFVPPPEHAHLSVVEYTHQVDTGWLLVPFVLLYLVPLLLVDYIGGLGRNGLVSIAVYGLVWGATAAYLQLPAFLIKGLLMAIPVILAYKFTTWVFSGRYGDGSHDVPNDLWDW